MGCYKCGNNADLLTVDGEIICHNCAEKEGYTICLELGKVISDKNFHCDNICNDCIYKDNDKESKL